MEIMILLFVICVGVYDLFHLKEYLAYFKTKKEREEILFQIKDFKKKTKFNEFWSSNMGIMTTLSIVVAILIWTLIMINTKGIGFNQGFIIFMLYSLLVKNVRESTKIVRGSSICKSGISFGMTFTKWHRINRIDKRFIRGAKPNEKIAVIKVSFHSRWHPGFIIVTGNDVDAVMKIISDRNKKGFMTVVTE